jgi:serine/threonine protein kinase
MAVEPRVYTYAALAAATDNFDKARELGEGGFGAVYRGRLEDGREIAVKKLSQEAGAGTAAGLPSVDQFEAEVEGVAAYQHPNLLPVIGYCDEPGGAGSVRRSCIVYPLMSCNLEDKLADDRPPALTWQQRVRILTEVFRGVVALHDPATGNGTLIHRDIKTANVLLDKQLTGRLGDFGLVRALPELGAAGAGRTHLTTANLIGTHQYMAPEYLKSGEISPKTDVYGCGIVALELLTGRHSRPEGDGKQDLKKLMEELLDDIHDDGATEGNTRRAMEWADRAAGAWPEKVVAELAALAAECLLDRPRKRLAATCADPPGALERMEGEHDRL